MNDPPPMRPLDDVRRILESQGFLRHVGARVDEVARGRVTVSVEAREELLQQHGFFHGGVVAFLVDNATTAAAGTMLRDPNQAVLTAEYKLNFLSPGLGERLSCTADVVKAGKRLSVVEAKVHAHDRGAVKIVAVALATIAVVDKAGLDG